MIKNISFPVLRILLAMIFIVSGFTKLMQPPQNFLAVINQFEIISGAPALWAAHVLPWCEFIFGVFLAAGLCTRLSLSVLWVFNTMFIAALSSAMFRRLPVGDCGCFGKAISLPLWGTLVVDLVLWLLFLLLFRELSLTKRVGLDIHLERKD